jgi:subtilisin family serine protease
MRRCFVCVSLLFCVLSARPASAGVDRIIVRDTSGWSSLANLCPLLGCTVSESLDGTLGQLFLVTAPSSINPNQLILALESLPGIADAEIDQWLLVQQSSGTSVPSGLYDTTPINYFGATVWDGYANQTAAQIIRLQDAQSAFNTIGAGIVAVIDTGIDPSHPAFANIVVTGYDFTRNAAGGSELSDVPQWDTAGQPQPAQISQSAMGVVDPYNAQMLSSSQYSAFGHGTMVAGIIHLVAPGTNITALKAFSANGSGYLSDVLRAVYYAVQHNAKVINMSFTFPSSSHEMQSAVQYANSHQVICAAAVGNDGANEVLYPAGYTNAVMGIASTNDDDVLSSFSNYGSDIWVASPGEAIITTYPFGTYAAGWGTSFSTPFVSGAVALLLSLNQTIGQSQAANALSSAQWISPEVGHGRIDLYEALSAFTTH